MRVGNGAWNQQQIDVYGELLGAADRLADRITTMDDDVRAFLIALADAAAARWREPDQGIWEIRGEPRHFLYSKVMCWVALDRAIRLAGPLRAGDRVGRLAGHPGRDRRDRARAGLERDGGRVHPVLRIRRAGRRRP